MKVREWPNKLGWDVGNHEVVKRPDSRITIRKFRRGESYPYLVDVSVLLFGDDADLVKTVKETHHGRFLQ